MEWKTYKDKERVVFLPEYINEHELLDITGMGCLFKKFLDKETGKIHNCEEYYNQYLKGKGF